MTLLQPSTFASTLRQRQQSSTTYSHTQTMTSSATIDQTCPSCGYSEMNFYSLQMRSADEGATIFYHCIHCGYRYSTRE
ncbi:hypothetical protein PCK1_001486 [Pneumocystis canis]|nr:hypothetical protein PCK1_001486 [Pneumocystis canis]